MYILNQMYTECKYANTTVSLMLSVPHTRLKQNSDGPHHNVFSQEKNWLIFCNELVA